MKRRKMKESYTFALLCVGLLFFATQGCSSGAESEAVAAPRVSGASQVFPVTLAVARRAPIKRTVHFVGTMEAGAEAGVAAEVDGRLLSVDADLGDEVVSGQVLATLDGAALAARLREAETLLVRAQSELDRASRLGSEGVIFGAEIG